jgi:hypothetical protein
MSEAKIPVSRTTSLATVGIERSFVESVSGDGTKRVSACLAGRYRPLTNLDNLLRSEEVREYRRA